LMVIPVPAYKASQGPPITTGGDHHWWHGGVGIYYDFSVTARNFATEIKKISFKNNGFTK